MAKIFSFIGIPSPKNYTLNRKILFKADLFVHALQYLFIAVILIITLRIEFNLEGHSNTDLKGLRL
jgi:hypothetical protein